MDRLTGAQWLLVLVVDNEMDAARARQAVAQAGGGAAPAAHLAPGELPRLDIPTEAQRIYARYQAAGRLLLTIRADAAVLPGLRGAAEAAGAYGARVYVQRAGAPPPAADPPSTRHDPAPAMLGDRGLSSSATEFRSGGEASRGGAAL